MAQFELLDIGVGDQFQDCGIVELAINKTVSPKQIDVSLYNLTLFVLTICIVLIIVSEKHLVLVFITNETL